MSFREEVPIGWLMHNPECRLGGWRVGKGSFLQQPYLCKEGAGKRGSQSELG